MVIIALCTLLYCASCNTDNEVNSMERSGYIVGYDPCTINHSYPIGYIFVTEDLRDTVVTYNLSDRQFRMPASVILHTNDTLYKIPAENFQNFRTSVYFPDSLRYRYPLHVEYRLAKEDELIFNLCSTDLIFVTATQVIIETAHKKTN